jgi:hypothetical protein
MMRGFQLVFKWIAREAHMLGLVKKQLKYMGCLLTRNILLYRFKWFPSCYKGKGGGG